MFNGLSTLYHYIRRGRLEALFRLSDSADGRNRKGEETRRGEAEPSVKYCKRQASSLTLSAANSLADMQVTRKSQDEHRKRGMGGRRKSTYSQVDQYAPISSSRDILNRVAVLALLLATLVGYLCIGSLCFSALESETEQQRWEEGKARIEAFVQDMVEGKSSKNATEYSEDLTILVRKLADEANPYIYEGRNEAWSFTGGLYVSVSTVTTIGYGNIYPVTTGGQVFLLVFALIGIPLCFLFIAYLGALLAQSVEYIFNFPLRDRNKNRIMLAVLLFSASLVLVELIIFSLWIKYGLDREMTYWDSFYFAFVSFTTIGFGNHGFYNGDNANIAKVCFTLLIVILCLAPLALYINLIVRDVITAASPILEKIGVTEHPADPEQEMISQTKEFQGEPYGSAEERTS